MAVGVIYGGRSGEHDVSLCSAASVVSALDENRYDVVAIGIDRRGVWHVQDSPVIVDDPVFGQKLKLDETGDWLVRHYDCNGKLSLRDMESGRDVHVDVVFPVVHGSFCRRRYAGIGGGHGQGRGKTSSSRCRNPCCPVDCNRQKRMAVPSGCNHAGMQGTAGPHLFCKTR